MLICKIQLHHRVRLSLQSWMGVSNNELRKSILKSVALLLSCKLYLQAYRAPTINRGRCGLCDALRGGFRELSYLGIRR